MKTRFFYLLKLIGGLTGIVACSFDHSQLATESLDADIPSEQTFALKPFVSCTQLENYIENNAIELMKNRIHNSRYKVWLLNAENSNTSGLLDNSDYTTTNSQVDGVDEADILKNNGRHIFTISDNSVKIVKSWPAADSQTLTSIAVPEKPTQLLLLKNNKLIVISEKFDSANANAEFPKLDLWMPMFRRTSISSVVRAYDVSIPETPKLVHEYLIPGKISHARSTNESVQLIAEKNLTLPNEVVLYYNFDESDSDAKIKLAEIIEKNIEIIKAKNLNFWLGNVTLTQDQHQFMSQADINISCRNSYYENQSKWTSMLRVINLNFANSLFPSINQNLLLSEVDAVHRSRNSLYLTHTQWINTEEEQSDRTIIHKFTIPDYGIPDYGIIKYTASGAVDGRPVDQFAMDEYNNSFRIATTLNHWKMNKDASTGLHQWESFLSNNVYILKAEKSELKTIGETKPFELGERIYSARFAGNKGFIVTFKQVDPLLTLDLQDSSNPKIIGALKIPGFSTYIHLIDDAHLLTIGEHIPEPDENGFVNRAEQCIKLALFDVSNLANPREIATYKFPVGSWSEARFEHKAFTYFKAKNLLAVPVVAYKKSIESDENRWFDNYDSSLELFKIDLDNGISNIGNININELAPATPQNWSWWYDNLLINRSIFTKDYVYAITNKGLKVANLTSLEIPVAVLNFD